MSGWGARIFSNIMHRLDPLVISLTNGKTSASTILTGYPIIQLTTIGAKSGLPRSVPLMAVPDGDRLGLIASNWGRKKHPAWYANLCAHPQVVVTIDNRSRNYSARPAEGEERERFWNKAVAMYAGYALYEERAAGREIPVVILEPDERASIST